MALLSTVRLNCSFLKTLEFGVGCSHEEVMAALQALRLARKGQGSPAGPPTCMQSQDFPPTLPDWAGRIGPPPAEPQNWGGHQATASLNCYVWLRSFLVSQLYLTLADSF